MRLEQEIEHDLRLTGHHIVAVANMTMVEEAVTELQKRFPDAGIQLVGTEKFLITSLWPINCSPGGQV